MYQLVSAVVKPLTGNARWRSMDIGNIPLTELFASFKKVIAVLSSPFLTANVAFDIESVRATHGGDVNTFNQFLVMIGSAALATSDTLPVINTRYANYADAFHAGYKITPTHPTASFSSPMPSAEKTWLLVTKEALDYKFFYDRCLVNVNGFYHLTDYSDDGVFVVDGMKSCFNANRNEMGILSFMHVGTLEFISITDEMIYKQDDSQVLKNNCYVDTGVDLSTKSVLLVLGGYLHVLDKRTFSRVSASAFSIDFSNLPLIKRYYESYKTLDLSSLELETSSVNPDQISVPNLFSDEVLRKYLQLSQTFFVVLDNPDIFVEFDDIKASPYPGVYSTPAIPQYPIMVGAGRHETCWYRPEWGQYSLQFSNTWESKYIFETVDQRSLVSVDAARQPTLGFRNSNAQFVMIGSDL